MYVMILDYENNVMEIEFIAEYIEPTVENVEEVLYARGYRTKSISWMYADKDMLKELAMKTIKEL